MQPVPEIHVGGVLLFQATPDPDVNETMIILGWASASSARWSDDLIIGLHAKAERSYRYLHNAISRGGRWVWRYRQTLLFAGECGGMRKQDQRIFALFLLRLSDGFDKESWELAKRRANHRSLAAQGYKYSAASRRTLPEKNTSTRITSHHPFYKLPHHE
jgi:hypothetical protein